MTSTRGNVIPPDNLIEAGDFLLLHGNGVPGPARIREMVDNEQITDPGERAERNRGAVRADPTLPGRDDLAAQDQFPVLELDTQIRERLRDPALRVELEDPLHDAARGAGTKGPRQ